MKVKRASHGGGPEQVPIDNDEVAQLHQERLASHLAASSLLAKAKAAPSVGSLRNLDTELESIIDALRVTREAATNLAGLKRFRAALNDKRGLVALKAYLRRSPDCVELHNIWDTQLKVGASEQDKPSLAFARLTSNSGMKLQEDGGYAHDHDACILVMR
jgi:hypothetical protein